MAANLKAYLYLRRSSGHVTTTSFSDFDSLVQEWGVRGDQAALIHVGYASLSLDEVDGLLTGWDGRTLLTSSAKHVLHWPFDAGESVVGHIGERSVHAISSEESASTEHGVAPPSAWDGDATESSAAFIERLASMPEWLLRMTVRELELPVRPRNALERALVVDVRQITQLGPGGLLQLTNFGQTSLDQLAERLRTLLRAGPSVPAAAAAGPPSPAMADKESILRSESRSEAAVQAVSESFGSMLNEMLASLDERRRLVMTARMGAIGRAATLEEIGAVLGVTRERVRQIESGVLARRRTQWRSVLAVRMAPYASMTAAPTMQELESADPWFRGIGDHAAEFFYVLEEMCDPPWFPMQTEHGTYVTRIHPSSWTELMRAVRKVANSAASSVPRLTRGELIERIESVLPTEGPTLHEVVWRELKDDLHFVRVDDRIELLSFGRSIEAHVTAILKSAERPLHYREIVSRLAADGIEASLERVRNICVSIGLQFGPGTYGAWHHVPFTDEQADLLVRETEEIVFEEDPSQQWHAGDLCERLVERGVDIGIDLTPYLLGIVLQRSKHMHFLGRMIWTGDSSTTRERLEIHAAICEVLESAGRPLTTEEVRERVSRIRGLATAFQVHPQGEVIRVGPATWGLRRRDVPFTDQEVQLLCDQLAAYLHEKGSGLHISEIENVLHERAPWAVRGISPHMYFGLARHDARLATTTGGVMYLAAWGETRRETVLDATAALLLEAGADGLTLDEGHRRLEARIGRKVLRLQFSSAALANGAEYDDVRRCWVLPAADAQP
jgi:hypothetical protein